MAKWCSKRHDMLKWIKLYWTDKSSVKYVNLVDIFPQTKNQRLYISGFDPIFECTHFELFLILPTSFINIM